MIGALAVSALATPIGSVSGAVAVAATSAAAAAIEELFAGTAFPLVGGFIASEIPAATNLLAAVANATIRFCAEEGFAKLTDAAYAAGNALGDCTARILAEAAPVYHNSAALDSVAIPTSVKAWDTPSGSTSYTEYGANFLATDTHVTVSGVGQVTETITDKTVAGFSVLLNGRSSDIMLDNGLITDTLGGVAEVDQGANGTIFVGLPLAAGQTTLFVQDARNNVVNFNLSPNAFGGGRAILSFASNGLNNNSIEIVRGSGGGLNLVENITANGYTNIASAAPVSGVTEIFDISGPNAQITLSNAASFGGVISGFTSTDRLDLRGIDAESVTLVPDNTLLIRETNGTSLGLKLSAVSTGANFALASDGQGGSYIYALGGYSFSYPSLSGFDANTIGNDHQVVVLNTNRDDLGAQARLFDVSNGSSSIVSPPASFPALVQNRMTGIATVIQSPTSIYSPNVNLYVSATGIVAGNFTTTASSPGSINSNPQEGFVWQDGVSELIGGIPGEGTFFENAGQYYSAGNSSVSGVNDTGEVIGTERSYYQNSSGGVSVSEAAFTWHAGSISIFSYPGASYTFPEVINDVGDIGGVYQDGAGDHIFTLEHGVFRSFYTAPAGSLQALSINAEGTVFGTDYATGAGFAISKGSTSNFGTFKNLVQLFTNDTGVVAGNDGLRCFVSNNGSLSYFLTDGFIRAVSSSGEVVGTAYSGIGATREGFVYQNGHLEFINVPGSFETDIFDVTTAGTVFGEFRPQGNSNFQLFTASPVLKSSPDATTYNLNGMPALGEGLRLESPIWGHPAN